MDARNIEEIVVSALKKELVRLAGVADRAKAAADEYMNTGTEMIAIYEEFGGIVDLKESGKAVLNKLAVLRDREAKVNKVRKKDFLKLCNKQSKAEIERDSLISEIGMMEYRLNLRKAG